MKSTSIIRSAVAVALFAVATPMMALAVAAPEQGVSPFIVIRADSPTPAPKVKTVVAAVTDHLCRRPWDMEATDEEALQPVKDKARVLGANGLIDVRFDRHRTELKSMCWQKVTVTGTAVVFAAPVDR